MNRIQFQPGLSMPEFLELYGDEGQCEAALAKVRWPEGFTCPGCGGQGHCLLPSRPRMTFQCNHCHRQASIIAGTLFQGSNLPLKTWFLAIYWISQAKTGLSALALKRHLGVSYRTAWLVHHKLMQAMAERDDRYRLSGDVQVDDAYLGGERTGGKPGRGSENKVPFVAAVALDEKGRPSRIKLTALAAFTLGPSRRGQKATSRPAVLSAPMAWLALGVSARQGACMTPLSSGRANRPNCRNSAGSTPSWATSRPASAGPTTPLSSPNMPAATWRRSLIGSTDDFNSSPCPSGGCWGRRRNRPTP
jgi:transposase-like protein